MIDFFDSATTTSKAHDQLRSIIEHVLNWNENFLQEQAAREVSTREFTPDLTDKVFQLMNEDGALLQLKLVSGKPLWSLKDSHAFPGQRVRHLPDYYERELLIEKPTTIRAFASIWNRLREPVLVFLADEATNEAMMMTGAKGHYFLSFREWKSLEIVEPDSPDKGFLNYDGDAELWPLNDNNKERVRERLGGRNLTHAIAFGDNIGFVPGFEDDSLFEERIFYVFIPVEIEKIALDGQGSLVESLGSDWFKGTFSYSFPELNEITKNSQDVELEDLEVLLRNVLAQGSDKFKAFGFEIPSDMIAMIGLPLLAAVQLYFLLHFRAFSKHREFAEEFEPFPWVGLYPQLLPQSVFLLTATMLPSITQIVLIGHAAQQPPENGYWWVPAGLAGMTSIIVAVATALEVRSKIPLNQAVRFAPDNSKQR
jgi:hypothetical protein